MRIDHDPAGDLAEADRILQEHDLGADAAAQVARTREALARENVPQIQLFCRAR